MRLNKIPCLRLTQWYLQRRSIKSPKRYFKVYALRVWVFFYRIWAPLCWQKWLRVWANYYLPLFYFPTGNLQFFVQMHSFFLWSFTLCTIIICKSSNIAFFVHISLISFCFQRCYFTKIQCMFFLSSTSWRLTRNWCLTRRIQMRGHHLISCCWEWRSWWRRTLFTWI